MNRRGGVKNQMAPPTHFLPDHMKALFAARAPLPYLPPPTRLREPAAPAGGGLVDGLSAWTWALEQGPPPPRHHDETPWQASDRRRAERAAEHIEEQAAARAACMCLLCSFTREPWPPRECSLLATCRSPLPAPVCCFRAATEERQCARRPVPYPFCRPTGVRNDGAQTEARIRGIWCRSFCNNSQRIGACG